MGDEPSGQFCADWYLQNYRDVAAAGVDPLEHYLAYGRLEGRWPRENRAFLLEAKLWGGFSQYALTDLRRLLADGAARPDERAYAAWVLAQWLALRGDDWSTVAKMAAQARAAGCPSHPGPLLLEGEALRRDGRVIDCRRLLRRALTQQTRMPDLYLAYANAWTDGSEQRRLGWINRALSLADLAPLTLRNLGQPASLDNLMVSCPPPLETPHQPKVSVIVPLYNAEATIVTALDSLLQQTWRNLELLVVDDCSSDGSLGLVLELAKRDQRVRLLRHETNLGAYAARNTGLAQSTGDFVTTHDADDWSHPQKLAVQVAALLAAPVLQASVSHWVRCSSELVFWQPHPQASWVHCNVSSLMFRRQVVEELGYWDAVRVGADAEYYYRILSHYGAQALREVLRGVPLAFGRYHPHSLTQRAETHARSLYYGLRREYQESFNAWHREIRHTRLPPLPARPLFRPFPVPQALLLQTRGNELKRLVIADFSADSPQASQIESCLEHVAKLAGATVIFHLSDVTRATIGRVSDRVRALMRRHEVVAILPGQVVRCSTLFVWTHSGLAHPLDDAPEIEVVDHAWLLADPSTAADEHPALPPWIRCAGTPPWRAREVPASLAGWAVLDCGLFDPDWYLRRYPDLKAAGVDPLRHFLAHGAREDRDPGPDFSSSGYRARCLGPQAEGERHLGDAVPDSPVVDYAVRGKGLGCAPLPVFEGAIASRADRPTILLCGHLAGPQLFGAEWSLLDVLDALKQLLVNVVVALPGVHHAAYLSAVEERATCIRVLPYGWWNKDIPPCGRTVEHFRHLMQAHKIDGVYLNTVVLDEPLLAARGLGLPVVVHVRELPGSDPALCEVLGASPDGIRQRLLAQADILIANSRTVRHYLEGGIDGCSGPLIHVVPNIVDCARFDLPFPPPDECFNVAMIGSNTAKKGVADFIELARRLATLSRSIRCLLIGPATPAVVALRGNPSADPFPGNVVFSGYAATPQEALSQAHVVVNLSRVEESFGRTVLEAMASRRPVVCYNCGALRELVVDGQTGFLVPPGDVQQAAERIHLLQQSPHLWWRMGETARTRARTDFGAAAMSAALGRALSPIL